MNTRAYLQGLCNRFGDFKTASSIIVDGAPRFTKHRSVLECWHSDDGLSFMDGAQHRQILPNEIVFDIDEDPSIEKLNKLCDWFESNHLTYKAYSTGSKGYHCHVFTNDLHLLSTNNRMDFREYLLKETGCDLQKKSDKSMIAIEGVHHWKSGKPKQVIRQSKYDHLCSIGNIFDKWIISRMDKQEQIQYELIKVKRLRSFPKDFTGD